MTAPFTKHLLKWNRAQNGRQMPWKGEKDPYKIWLSEIILQQTRVDQGLAYYERFIHAFPTVKKLAAADENKVFKLWEGLGYYNRCKNLIATARFISQQLKGKFPSAYNKLLELKGIGPYTAAAISSFAFNEKRAVVDGNVQRIFSRYFGITTPVDSTEGKKLFQQLADSLVPSQNPGIYNQAIMDFGATICKPANPLCQECCQRKDCQALRFNKMKELPVKGKKLIRQERWFNYFIIEVNHSLYIRKRGKDDIWQNLYEFVLYETNDALIDSPGKWPFLKKIFGRSPYEVVDVSKPFRQSLTHQHINGKFIRIRCKEIIPGLHEYELVKKNRLKQYAFPALINAYLG